MKVRGILIWGPSITESISPVITLLLLFFLQRCRLCSPIMHLSIWCSAIAIVLLFLAVQYGDGKLAWVSFWFVAHKTFLM